MRAPTRPCSREVRIRLTGRCNYACFFCHDEGGCGPRGEPSFAELRPLLDKLTAEGRRDFTLTGGEPLLNKPVLLDALRWFSGHPSRPEVTLITNGSLMDDTVADALAACTRARVHLSLHAASPEAYSTITGQRKTTPAELLARFARLSSLGIELKVNAVILRDMAESGARLEGLLAFARATGASRVKLIEMLVTEEHPELAEHVLSVEDLARRLPAGARTVSTTPRTRVIRLRAGWPLVELTRCACRLGCAACENVRPDSFTGGGTYHPCFLSPHALPVTPDTLEHTLNRGRQLIRNMAKRYGEGSPLLMACPSA